MTASNMPVLETPSIRIARSTDISGIMKIETKAFDQAIWFTQERVLQFVDDPTGVFLVAESSNILVGSIYGALDSSSKLGYIWTLAVLPEYQGKRLGQCLMEAMMYEFRIRGASQVRLHVEHDNSRARKLYKRLGFQEICLELDFVGKIHGRHAYLMDLCFTTAECSQ